jgi:hypothetical protein
MSTWQDDDAPRTPAGGGTERPGGKRDMTATGGSGSRSRDDDGDIVGGTSRGSRSSGTSSGTGGLGGGASTVSHQPSRPVGALLAALLAGLLLGGLATAAYLGSQDDDDEAAVDDFAGAIDESRYQAVILSNDKVYFGQLESISDDFFRLESAFFLRETREDADAEPVRALLPVNREIHAPENTMLIRKDEVVLVENLAKDSPILTEIKRQKG